MRTSINIKFLVIEDTFTGKHKLVHGSPRCHKKDPVDRKLSEMNSNSFGVILSF